LTKKAVLECHFEAKPKKLLYVSRRKQILHFMLEMLAKRNLKSEEPAHYRCSNLS